MLEPKAKFDVALNEVMEQNNKNKKIRKKIATGLIKRNFDKGLFLEIWNGKKHLEDISDMPFLYWLIKELFESTQNPKIDPILFFTEAEIADGDNYIRPIEDVKLEYPLIFENVIGMNDERFVFFLTIKDIKKLFVDATVHLQNYSERLLMRNVDCNVVFKFLLLFFLLLF